MRKHRKHRTYACLFALTALLIAGLVTARILRERAVPLVETTVLEQQDIKETVVCTGTVGAADGVEVYTTVPCIAGDVAVEVGDRVQAGDVLLTVDRASTLSMAVSAGLAGVTGDAASLLPEVITAPCAGVVSAVSATAGDTLDTATPCVVLSENGGVVINIAVRESVLPQLRIGQEVTVSGVAFEKKSYRGVVTAIASSARVRVNGTTTETVVDAVVELAQGEVDDSLLIGLSAKATVIVSRRADVLLLPYDCITQNDEGQAVAYRLEGDTAVACIVKTGDELAQGVVVREGLSAGDVVVKVPEQLDGKRVRVKAEAAS